MPARHTPIPPALACVAAYAPREAARQTLRRAFPRRRARLLTVKSAADLERVFRRELVDAAIVDIDHASPDTWNAVRLAREFPSAPLFALSAYRGGDAAAIARCTDADVADVIAEGVDDAALRELVVRAGFGARFAAGFATPPESLALTSPMQRTTWRALVSQAGRPVHTAALARSLGLTREHLSRRFASKGAPNLKRVIDLVRLLAAAELSKNPGYDVADVARVLGFASASHLATTAQRVTGAKPASLARLRSVDLLRRFADGRSRSRGGA